MHMRTPLTYANVCMCMCICVCVCVCVCVHVYVCVCMTDIVCAVERRLQVQTPSLRTAKRFPLCCPLPPPPPLLALSVLDAAARNERDRECARAFWYVPCIRRRTSRGGGGGGGGGRFIQEEEGLEGRGGGKGKQGEHADVRWWVCLVQSEDCLQLVRGGGGGAGAAPAGGWGAAGDEEVDLDFVD